MKKDMFLSGYCLEYAIALRDFYKEKGKDVFIGGVINYLKEQGDTEEEVFTETQKGVYRIDGFLEEVEVAHFFVGIKEKNGIVRFEDCKGEISDKDIKNSSLFSKSICCSGQKIIEFEDEYEAEGFSAGIEDSVVCEAKKMIKKEKNKTLRCKM